MPGFRFSDAGSLSRRLTVVRLSAVLAGAAAVVAGVLAITGWMLWDARGTAWTQAIQSAQNVSITVETDIRRHIQFADTALQAVASELAATGEMEGVHISRHVEIIA